MEAVQCRAGDHADASASPLAELPGSVKAGTPASVHVGARGPKSARAATGRARAHAADEKSDRFMIPVKNRC